VAARLHRPPKTTFRRWAEIILVLLLLVLLFSGWGAPLLAVLARSIRLIGLFLLELGAVLTVLFGLLILVLGGLYHFGRPAAVSFTDYCRQKLRRIFLK